MIADTTNVTGRWEKTSTYWQAVNNLVEDILQELEIHSIDQYYISEEIGSVIMQYASVELRAADILNVLSHTHSRDMQLTFDKKSNSSSALIVLREIALNVMITDCKTQIKNYFSNPDYRLNI